jgi:hypothetical protein
MARDSRSKVLSTAQLFSGRTAVHHDVLPGFVFFHFRSGRALVVVVVNRRTKAFAELLSPSTVDRLLRCFFLLFLLLAGSGPRSCSPDVGLSGESKKTERHE